MYPMSLSYHPFLSLIILLFPCLLSPILPYPTSSYLVYPFFEHPHSSSILFWPNYPEISLRLYYYPLYLTKGVGWRERGLTWIRFSIRISSIVSLLALVYSETLWKNEERPEPEFYSGNLTQTKYFIYI